MLQQPLDAARARPIVRERDGGYRVGVVLLAAFGLTAFASMQMHDLLSPFGVSALEWVLLALFALNFLWISAAASTAAIGAMVLLFASRRPAPAAALSTKSRTAIVFPIYNEDPAGVFGAAEAVLEELHAAGVSDRFECFFLSDTNNPERALAEEAVFNALREARPELTFHYRRRTINRVRKSGNIEDFVHRWGDRYDYMIVFDADSLMSADAICELVRRMDNQPATALIQTLPTLIRAQTLFARTQQFAMRAYGPIFGAGLSWWSGGAGNYWGHNAIIRVAAFAAHAGLPDLPGKAPLGGPILSHDFVEAALLRRAGWRVEIAWDIAGSYEQSPPTLADMMARDARWIQGNLQHIRVLGARGFDGLSRLHIASGVMGYGSSLLWALLLIVGIVLAAGEDPGLSYFSDDSPYPMWPVSDAGNGLSLALLTAVVVLAPKWLSLLLWTVGRLPGWSRSWRFPVGMFIELILSAVMAPVQMVSQTIGIVRTLLGHDGGWASQNREGGRFDWAGAFRLFLPHMAIAAAIGVCALVFDAPELVWTLPLALPLLAAAPTSFLVAQRLSPSSVLFQTMLIPEERTVPSVQIASEQARGRLVACDTASFQDAVQSEERSRSRRDLVDGHWPLGADDVHTPTGLVLARLEHALRDHRPVGALTPAERMAVLNNPRLARQLRKATKQTQSAPKEPEKAHA